MSDLPLAAWAQHKSSTAAAPGAWDADPAADAPYVAGEDGGSSAASPPRTFQDAAERYSSSPVPAPPGGPDEWHSPAPGGGQQWHSPPQQPWPSPPRPIASISLDGSLGQPHGHAPPQALQQSWQRASLASQQQQLAAVPVPPVPQAQALAPPPGMDPAAFIAGQHAGLQHAFQQALPSQQALGQLFSAVETLHQRLAEESGQWRAVQVQSSKVAQTLEAMKNRLDAMEFAQLPRLQEKWEEAACRLPEQHQAFAEVVAEVLALLREQQAAAAAVQARAGGSSAAPLPLRPLHWLLATAGGYTAAAVSKADVAVVLLSRRILLADLLPAASSGSVGSSAAARRVQAALTSALFVAAVEAAWQAHERLVMRSSPEVLRRAAAPLQLGLRVARVAVWSAALVLSASQLREACAAAAGSAAGTLARVRLPTASLPAWAWPAIRRKPAAEGGAAEAAEKGGDPGMATVKQAD
eukprot:scaffold7.g3395.t1